MIIELVGHHGPLYPTAGDDIINRNAVE